MDGRTLAAEIRLGFPGLLEPMSVSTRQTEWSATWQRMHSILNDIKVGSTERGHRRNGAGGLYKRNYVTGRPK